MLIKDQTVEAYGMLPVKRKEKLWQRDVRILGSHSHLLQKAVVRRRRDQVGILCHR